MSDFSRNVERARSRVQADWSDSRTDAALLVAARRRRRAAQLKRAGAALLLLAAASAVVRLHRREAPRVVQVPPPVEGLIRYADGSTAIVLDADSEVRTAASSPARTVVQVLRGGARFVVTHNPARLFRVEAGPVAVEVLGTEFTVERKGERVRVSVTRGRVRARFGDGQTSELGTGESELFPPEAVPAAAPPREEPAPPPTAPASPLKAARRWIELAQQGDFDGAYAILAGSGAHAVRDDPGEVLLAADVARLSHHPEYAAHSLRQLVQRHRQDPRAAMAAFTLGRVLLDDLGRPAEAAQAFADVRAIELGGQLSPDALAREVEAWSRAGELERARERALEYLRRYPVGNRLRSVRRYGGLE
jgi:transmembrane sensor